MPAPYSDNLYSGDVYVDVDVDVDEDDNVSGDNQHDAVLSPTNGYFHASSPPTMSSPDVGFTSSSSQPEQQHRRQSSNVPWVPNVLVEDPTLQEESRAAAKAKEAEEERLINSPAGGHSSTSNVAQTQRHPTESHQSQQPYQPYQPYPQLHPHPPPHLHSYINAHPNSHQASSSPFVTNTASPSSAPTSPTHYHRRSVDEQVSNHTASRNTTPLTAFNQHHHRQQHGDAPPAYSPSPSSPPQSSGYQTFAPPHLATSPSVTMGVPEEQQGLLSRHPESMGAPPNDRPLQPAWRRFKDSAASSTWRKKIKSILGVLVIISIIVALSTTVSLSPPHKRPDIIDKSPVKRPQTGNNGGMQWDGSLVCLDKQIKFPKTTEAISFGTERRLSVVQKLEKDNHYDGTSPHISGEIILQAIDDSSEGNIEVEIISNDENLRANVHFDKRKQRLEIITPRRIEWRRFDPRPCIQIRATVSIPRSSYLYSLNVEAIQLDVQVRDGVVVGVSEGTALSTVSGKIDTGSVSGDKAPYALASRKITVQTVSGNIKGWFPLYDLLKIDTVSGKITTDVGPKPAFYKHPEAAALHISSVSGDIAVTEPLDKALSLEDPETALPSRDYVIHVTTTSGKVFAQAAMTSHAKFESQSGDFDIRLLPVLDTSSHSQPELFTDTKSGRTTLNVLEPLWVKDGASVGHFAPKLPTGTDELLPPSNEGIKRPPPSHEPFLVIHPDIKHLLPQPDLELKTRSLLKGSDDDKAPALELRSHHASISGNFKLVYPASWEGRLTASTLSGSQKIRGEGLQIDSSGGMFKKTQAHKGKGGSLLTVDSMSGNEDVLIGKDK